MFCRRVPGECPSASGTADGVANVKIVSPASDSLPAVPPQRSASPPSPPPMTLPGLVGGSAAWRRACRAAETSYDSGEWMTLEGEGGAGKLSVIRAVHQRRSPAGRFYVADASDPDFVTAARAELTGGAGMLVIRRIESASPRSLRALMAALQEAQQRDIRVAVTLNRAAARADLTALLRFFPATVEVPPLRHHAEDLTELVPFFLARLSQQRLSCSPAAMQLLLRHNWPGNTAQLWDVLRQVVQRRRAGSIQPQDLPPECWAVSRRVLSPLESMERDAIVESLRDHDGNKIRAARALGMSRATIYRRIHEYGIVTTPG
jgi:transcriptional regulator of acetoin/glycerol metabolism